jgi:hypothetical protein
MNFTKAIYFKDGKCLTITEKEAEGIIAGLNAGGKWVSVQGEFISADNIARIGNHTATAQIKSLEKSQAETEMKVLGKGSLVELKKEEEKKIAIDNALKEKRIMIGKEYEDWVKTEVKEIENKPQTSEEAMNGEPMYYIDKETGEKMYS